MSVYKLINQLDINLQLILTKTITFPLMTTSWSKIVRRIALRSWNIKASSLMIRVMPKWSQLIHSRWFINTSQSIQISRKSTFLLKIKIKNLNIHSSKAPKPKPLQKYLQPECATPCCTSWTRLSSFKATSKSHLPTKPTSKQSEISEKNPYYHWRDK